MNCREAHSWVLLGYLQLCSEVLGGEVWCCVVVLCGEVWYCVVLCGEVRCGVVW